MAGGFGRRLAPITDRMPKPLVPVNDKPILEHTIIALAQHKLSRIFISVNYKREMIKDHFRDGSKWGVQIEYLEENEPRGTAGALSLMPRNGGAPSQVLVINGDILTNLDFTALLDFHGQQGNPATMCVRQHSTPIPYGVVQFDGPHMEQIVEKPEHVCFISAGVYVLSSTAIEKIPTDGFFDMPELFKVLMRDGKRPGVFPLREVWVDIGSHKDLARAGDELEKIMALRSGSPSIPLVLNGVPRPQKLGARTAQPVSADRDWHTNGSARSASS
jgi:NDP-sugar pyrophosphorylase family protein